MLEIGPADANVIECPFSMVKAPSSIPIKKEEEEKGKRRGGMREESGKRRGVFAPPVHLKYFLYFC